LYVAIIDLLLVISIALKQACTAYGLQELSQLQKMLQKPVFWY